MAALAYRVLRVPFKRRGRGKVVTRPVPGVTGTRTIRHSPANKIIR